MNTGSPLSTNRVKLEKAPMFQTCQPAKHPERPVRRMQVLLFVVSSDYRLCGLVVRVSGYRYRGLGFDYITPSVVRRSGCVVSAAEELNESTAGVVSYFSFFCFREVSSEQHCKDGPQ